MICTRCNGTGIKKALRRVDGELTFIDVPCIRCNGTGEVKQNNEEWFAELSTREKAEYLSGMCVAAVRDFEWSETKRCCVSYWERWLKEEHHADKK